MDKLEKIFLKYLEEITLLDGELVIVKSTLNYYYKDFSTQEKHIEWLCSISPYRDLHNSKGRFMKTDFSSVLNKSNLETVIKRIESRESLFIFSQCYEVFESFLKNILIEYLKTNPDKINLLIPKYDKEYKSSIDISEFVNKIQKKGKNNKTLFWIVRKFSKDFKQIEADNFFQQKLNIWFDLISDIRHLTVHRRLHFDTKFIESLDKNKKHDIFNKSFEIKDGLIWSSKDQISYELIKLNSLAFLITSSLKRTF